MIKSLDPEGILGPQSSAEALCKDLMDAMHAISQPLTVLRASLGAPNMAAQPVEDLRKLMRLSSREVERLCVLFHCLQQFVVVEAVEAELESKELDGLISHTLEGVDLLFAVAGVALCYKPDAKATREVRVDSSRFEQALSSILLVALGSAVRNDEVIVRTDGTGGLLEVIVAPSTVSGALLAAETRLTIALAVANLRSQGAQMTWWDKPFSVKITLPGTETYGVAASGRA